MNSSLYFHMPPLHSHGSFGTFRSGPPRLIHEPRLQGALLTKQGLEHPMEQSWGILGKILEKYGQTKINGVVYGNIIWKRDEKGMFIDFPLPCLITRWCVTMFDFCNSSPKALGFRLWGWSTILGSLWVSHDTSPTWGYPTRMELDILQLISSIPLGPWAILRTLQRARQ